MNAQPAGCMHAKLSLISAYFKLGHSHTKNNYCMYMTIELSQLMLNLYVLISAGHFCAMQLTCTLYVNNTISTECNLAQQSKWLY